MLWGRRAGCQSCGATPAVWVVGSAPTEVPGQLCRSWQEAQGSLREPQDERTGAPLHPNSPIPPQHPALCVSQEKKAKERHVQRFLYTLWSSKKQPDVQSLVELLLAVRRCTPHWRRVGPLLLHCRYPWLPLHPWAASHTGSHQAAQFLGVVPKSLPLHALGMGVLHGSQWKF